MPIDVSGSPNAEFGKNYTNSKAATDAAIAKAKDLPPKMPPPPIPPIDMPGRPGDDDDMKARLAKVEAHLEHVQTDIRDIKQDARELRSDQKTDFRVTWAALITAAVALAGMMAKGFHWL